jgi:DNA-directed RNA polymerase sigma subunit (sigma70/sigma32)
MNETPIRIKLTDQEKHHLEQLARSLTAAYRDVIRAKIILLLAQDYTVSAVGRMVGRRRRIVRKWAERFRKKRLDGLVDAPRSGRPARFSPPSRRPPDQAGLRTA